MDDISQIKLLREVLRGLRCSICSREIANSGRLDLVKDGNIPLYRIVCPGIASEPKCSYSAYVAVFPHEQYGQADPERLAIYLALPFLPNRCQRDHPLDWSRREVLVVSGEEREVRTSCSSQSADEIVKQRVRWVFFGGIPNELPLDISKLAETER